MTFTANLHRALLLIAAAAVLGACSSAGRWEEPAPQQPVARPAPGAPAAPAATGELPRSKYGNPPFYEVYGVRYEVLPASTGYRAEGVASWYGRKFHGLRTSSGETYDMHNLTAAHTTLPIPTNARVTNLENGKSVIVRINDRGPFSKNRLIDLSYAAAVELDMIRAGTARVEVVALTGPASNSGPATGNAPAANNSAPASGNAPAASNTIPATGNAPATASTPASRPVPQQKTAMYLQVGAFSARENAQQLADRLNTNGISTARVYVTRDETPALYRVRIGPMYSIDEYDRMVQRVSLMQITDTQLVIDPA